MKTALTALALTTALATSPTLASDSLPPAGDPIEAQITTLAAPSAAHSTPTVVHHSHGASLLRNTAASAAECAACAARHDAPAALP